MARTVSVVLCFLLASGAPGVSIAQDVHAAPAPRSSADRVPQTFSDVAARSSRAKRIGFSCRYWRYNPYLMDEGGVPWTPCHGSVDLSEQAVKFDFDIWHISISRAGAERSVEQSDGRHSSPLPGSTSQRITPWLDAIGHLSSIVAKPSDIREKRRALPLSTSNVVELVLAPATQAGVGVFVSMHEFRYKDVSPLLGLRHVVVTFPDGGWAAVELQSLVLYDASGGVIERVDHPSGYE